MAQLRLVSKWEKTEKKVDPDFEGSAFQRLGLEKELCPTCGSHLKKDSTDELICLNGCHLVPEEAVDTFWRAWLEATAGITLEDLIKKGGPDGK